MISRNEYSREWGRVLQLRQWIVWLLAFDFLFLVERRFLYLPKNSPTGWHTSVTTFFLVSENWRPQEMNWKKLHDWSVQCKHEDLDRDHMHFFSSISVDEILCTYGYQVWSFLYLLQSISNEVKILYFAKMCVFQESQLSSHFHWMYIEKSKFGGRRAIWFWRVKQCNRRWSKLLSRERKLFSISDENRMFLFER